MVQSVDLERNPLVASDLENMNLSSMTNSPDLVPEKDEKSEPSDDELVYDSGYCWVVCLACFMLNACTWGMNSGFAIYFSVYINQGTFPEATKLDYAAIGGLALGSFLILTPFINYLMGLIGTRPTIILGNCLQFTSLMLASYCTKLWQLYLTQGLMQSAGMTLVSIPGTTLIPQFFRKKRVLAGGLASAGSGVGGITFNLGMQKVVQARNVHWALRVQSIISFGLVWIAVLIIKSRSKHHKIQFMVFDKLVAQMYAFWLIAFYSITCIFGYAIVLYMMDHYATSLGYSEYQGSIVSAVIQVGSAVGRPLVGFLSDRYGVYTLVSSSYLLSGILCLAMWIPARNYATVIAFALIMGAIMGSIWGTAAPMLARLVGIQKMNNCFSLVWTFLGMAAVTSPVIGTSLVKGGGAEKNPTAYLHCSIFAGVSFIVCSLSVLICRGFIIARDIKLASKRSEDTKEDQITQELDSNTLMSTKVPIGQALKYCLTFKNVKA